MVPTTHGQRRWMIEGGRNEVAKIQDLQRLNPGLGRHEKITTRCSTRVGLGGNNHNSKQSKNREVGALQIRGGVPRTKRRPHLLLPAQRRIHLGPLGPQGEPSSN